MKAILLVFAFLTGSLAFSQIELTRQVIGSLGQTETVAGGNVEISFTAGEAMTQTVFNDSLTLTQGFHQPGFKGFLEFSVEVTNTRCPTSTDGSAMIKNLVGCTPPYTIEWSNGSNTLTAEDLGPGLFSVTVSTSQCAVTQTFEIQSQLVSECDLKFFNAFSPNDDGMNDGWEIENIESGDYDDNKVEIYNRWGQLIWDGTHYDNKNVVWKGRSNNNNELPDATYFYIATINGDVYKGYIELTR